MKNQAFYIMRLSSTNDRDLFNCQGLDNNAINMGLWPTICHKWAIRDPWRRHVSVASQIKKSSNSLAMLSKPTMRRWFMILNIEHGIFYDHPMIFVTETNILSLNTLNIGWNCQVFSISVYKFEWQFVQSSTFWLRHSDAPLSNTRNKNH